MSKPDITMPLKPDEITLLPIVASSLAALFTYLVGLAIFRVYFSPLAKFPGPKLAAITYWYEFYYDWWLNGQYIFKIERLHRKYGRSSTSLFQHGQEE